MLLTCLLLLQTQTFPLTGIDLSKVRQDWGKATVNRSVDGNAFSVGGVKYSSGLGTHAYSHIRLRLPDPVKFSSLVGVDEEAKYGTVVFEIYLDNKLAWSSGIMKSGQPAKQVMIESGAAKTMDLVVTDAEDGIDFDHADWINATFTLLRKAPVAVAIPPEKVEPAMPIAMGTPERTWIHGPRVIGCTAGKPFLFRIPVSGKRPFTFSANALPPGLRLDEKTGIISGSVTTKGSFPFTVTVKGPRGTDARQYTIASDGVLARTPPMGWNSWNVWGTSVDAAKVRAAADEFISEGLADFGYNYVNIDDAWEGQRGADGILRTNSKFPDLRGLADYVHGKGLKLGIYSSPGPKTCAQYEGSYKFERQDAEMYARAGIDYLKYDWCSYGNIAPRPTLQQMQEPYILMGDELRRTERDIVYSLCQYGMGEVFKWGKSVGGNLWRTTGDITDTWASMSGIGFQHSEKAVGVSPGGWNDPDMLVLGYVGWGPQVRPTRLKPNEQITHMTLWSMLAAPLIIGCDLTKLDKFTKALLCNHDVIEIDQDPLGVAATRKAVRGTTEVWTRPLWDGTTAVALFNRGKEKASVSATWAELGMRGPQPVRDCWRMRDLGVMPAGLSMPVPGHGAMLFKVGKPGSPVASLPRTSTIVSPLARLASRSEEDCRRGCGGKTTR